LPGPLFLVLLFLASCTPEVPVVWRLLSPFCRFDFLSHDFGVLALVPVVELQGVFLPCGPIVPLLGL